MNAALNVGSSINQLARAIHKVGHKRTVLVEGDMGWGKTSLLKLLAALLPTHVPLHMDMTTLDIGDLFVPNFKSIEGTGVVSFAPNEHLGLHLDKPVILMFDEIGKANPAVKNAAMRIILEREMNGLKLHPDSIVFATTNLGAEGVGDLLQAHQRNRITVMRMRKPTGPEWVEWAIQAGLDLSVIAWANDTPQVFHNFSDYKDPKENAMIYHPLAPERTAFATGRSMEAASDWMKEREFMDNQTLRAALTGTIGAEASSSLYTYYKLGEDLPKLEDIRLNPLTAKVPDSAAAVSMVVFKALLSMDNKLILPWMKYMRRLNTTAQGMFVNNARKDTYKHRDLVANTAEYGVWAKEFGHLFSQDK